MTRTPITIRHIFISSVHNFRGHHGKDPGTTPCEELDAVECVAGRGLFGDRYFDFKDNFKGQITFFSMEVLERVYKELGLEPKPPSSVRRNILVEGIDLNGLIGKRFTIQGIEFQGVEECKPCYWMDQALGPNAEDALQGWGGLRARILTDGQLHVGETEVQSFDD